ncbi:MAG: bifunctional folylpolyglutamate synthase/dihydrofolate synthase [Elusimicrobia bacterium]|nr:bifunctional folylpolyglutamate synthase/dihydrofolate synthase [Elusimicrobiota bacterium]
MTPYEQALEFLDLRRETVWDLGLGRIREIEERLGNPHRAVPCVHVAGTNGKGSFCALLASVLKEAGCRTGLYTSPHLCDVRERIQVDGVPVSEEDFGRAIAAVREAESEPATYFEALTAAAFRHFQLAGADIAVVEAGLGGRLDATNILEDPLLTVITSIGFDHAEHLGSTLSAIAAEKAGILKRGPCLCADVPEEALAAIRGRAAQTGCELAAPAVRLKTIRSDWRRGRQEVDGPFGRAKLNLLGRAAAANAALAVDAAGILNSRGLSIRPEALRAGFEAAVWPGRFQVIDMGRFSRESSGRTLVLDGAHNPQALEAFLSTWSDSPFARSRAVFMVGMMKDKDHESMLRLLAPHARRVLAVRPESPRALAPAILADRLKSLGCEALGAAQSPQEALEAWLESGYPVGVACGSFYLVGGLLRALAPDAQGARAG